MTDKEMLADMIAEQVSGGVLGDSEDKAEPDENLNYIYGLLNPENMEEEKEKNK